MSKLLTVAATALVLIASFASTPAEARAAAVAGKMRAFGRKGSIGRVCREDIKTLCAANTDKPQRRGDSFDCLSANIAEIKSEECLAVIKGQVACVADLTANPVEGCKSSANRGNAGVLRCLRKADPSTLSKECSESDFYKKFRFGPRGMPDKAGLLRTNKGLKSQSRAVPNTEEASN